MVDRQDEKSDNKHMKYSKKKYEEHKEDKDISRLGGAFYENQL